MNEKKIKLKTGEIWQERLVAGNGHSGVICSCEPYEEVLTYQNIELLMPTEEPRMRPDRQCCIWMILGMCMAEKEHIFMPFTRGCNFGSRHRSRRSKRTAVGW